MILTWWQGGKQHRLPMGTSGAEPPAEKDEQEPEDLGELDWPDEEGEDTDPSLALLADPESHAMCPAVAPDHAASQALGAELGMALARCGIKGHVGDCQAGPVITRVAFRPDAGVKISKVVNLLPDIALEMAVENVRVDVIPHTNLMGFEIPNRQRLPVSFEDILGPWDPHPHSLLMSLGVDIAGQPVHTDVTTLPHLLIAGATGSGKSVGLHGMLCSLLMRYSPAELRLCLIDTKRLEFGLYAGSRYLVGDVVHRADQVMPALARELARTRRRYAAMEAVGAQNLAHYCQLTGRKSYQRIVIVIDELADLLAHDSKGAILGTLQSLVQISRAAGIHILAATQRPSVDVVPGSLKANFPARITYKVASRTDSQVILGQKGGEQLLGWGDGLLLASGTVPTRFHSPYVSAATVRRIALR